MKLTVVLGANSDTHFDIELFSNPFVEKWAVELQWCLDNCEFNQQEAFTGYFSLEKSASILKHSCSVINKYIKDYLHIEENLLEQPQDYFNFHLKFEELSGEYGKPTRLFSIAPDELKHAIRNLNFFVHHVEKKKTRTDSFYISFNKDQYRRHPLSESDYDNFQFQLPAGTLTLHYAELGKDFVDLYKDDLPVTYANFKNLHFYSGEASLNFQEYDAFRDPGYLNWIKKNGFNPYDKTLGHGKLPLGRVIDIEDTCAKIIEHQHINRIIVKE